MKKFSLKFVASSALAVLIASSMAVSASAFLDYYDVPPYTPPSGGSSSGSGSGSDSGNTNPGDDTAPDEKTDESTGSSVVGEAAVNAAIDSGDEIDVVADEGSLTVQEAAIGAIAASDAPVTFDVADDDSDVDYTITIDPALITKVKAIDIAMNISVASTPTGKAVTIDPAQSGDFGMTLIITIPATAFEGMEADALSLYYVDDAGNISLVTDALTVNADGSVSVAISHASSYIITDVDLEAVMGGTDIDDDDDDDDDDDVIIGDDDDDTAGKDDTVVVNPGSANGNDSNPVTGTTLALGSLAVFAAAAVATSKKRK